MPKKVAKTIISPDATNGVDTSVTVGGKTTILLTMEEWKQAAQRGVRTSLQAFLFLGGGGTVYSYLTNLGIPPASVANLPSTGHPLGDAIAYALVFGFVVFLWNWLEFFLDIDLKAPKWRA